MKLHRSNLLLYGIRIARAKVTVKVKTLEEQKNTCPEAFSNRKVTWNKEIEMRLRVI